VKAKDILSSRNILLSLISLFLVFWTLIPIIYQVIIALTPTGHLATSFFGFEWDVLTPRYFIEVLTERIGGSFLKALYNSLLVATLVVVTVLIVSIPAAYTISRWKSKLSSGAFAFFMAVRTLPNLAFLVPWFLLLNYLRLLDTIAGLVLTQIAPTIPLAVWILKGFFDTLPIEAEEAAMMDGASRIRIIFQIIGPMMLPGIAVAGIMLFLGSYNAYLGPLVFTRNNAMTLPVKIAGYVTEHRIFYQRMLAAVTLGNIPSIIFYSLVSKYLAKGFAGLAK